jgi:protein-S-isoprenylcysteine O-methyltransferase
MVAMWTCKSNFNHVIMERRDEGHELVTHGVYKHLRHPSYFGWFWWCVGTQCLLCNPVCVVAHAVAAWDFFRKRIP